MLTQIKQSALTKNIAPNQCSKGITLPRKDNFGHLQCGNYQALSLMWND